MTSGRRIAKRAQAMQRRRAISHRITTGMPANVAPGNVLMLNGPRTVFVRVVSTPTPYTFTASRLGARP